MKLTPLISIPLAPGILFGILLGILSGTARADPDFAAFHARFRAAIAGNDAARVADLTRLPFLFEGRPRDRAGFLRLYPKLFSPPVRRCLSTAKAQAEGADKVVFCPPYGFYFDRQDGAWKLREFNADGEDMP